jgi:aryl-alcohol dehydrogenase-like predicted oxidoreductase
VNGSQFGLGLAALGRPGYINLGHADDLNREYSVESMQQHAHGVLDVAWKFGVRYFDAARSYGKAEAFLGSWIRDRKIAPGEITVGSKWGYTYTADWQIQTPDGVAHEVKRHELDVLQRQHAESVNEFGEYLNLYQIHSATLDSGVLENAEVLDHLAGLREGGLKIGLSVSGPNQSKTIEKALGINFDSGQLFDSVQATWNLLERSAGDALQLAHDSGIDVIVKEGLANGRLTSRNSEPEFKSNLRTLTKIASSLGATVDALSLAAVWNQPWTNTVLSGASTSEHLMSNLVAKELEWNEATFRELDQLTEVPEEYWSLRSALAWN